LLIRALGTGVQQAKVLGGDALPYSANLYRGDVAVVTIKSEGDFAPARTLRHGQRSAGHGANQGFGHFGDGIGGVRRGHNSGGAEEKEVFKYAVAPALVVKARHDRRREVGGCRKKENGFGGEVEGEFVQRRLGVTGANEQHLGGAAVLAAEGGDGKYFGGHRVGGGSERLQTKRDGEGCGEFGGVDALEDDLVGGEGAAFTLAIVANADDGSVVVFDYAVAATTTAKRSLTRQGGGPFSTRGEVGPEQGKVLRTETFLPMGKR
jgi:hypothetical protein